MEQTQNNEVLELLPISIANSNNFSAKCKFLIATLLFLNGLDKVKNDGYFFRTNQTLAKETNMTEANLLINLRKLESLKFISRKAGKRKEASEYRIDENAINSYIEISTKVKKYAIAKSNNSNNCNSDNNINSNKIDSINLRISSIESTLLVIQNTIDKIYHYCNSNNNSNNCNSTDTESDIDIEKESINKIILNNNINYNIEKIKTELVSTIEEVEVNETSSDINSNNEIDYNPIENKLKINNDVNEEILNKETLKISTAFDNNTENDSNSGFKDTGEIITNKTIEDVNGVENVGNNALKQVVVLTTENENKTSSTVDKDISNIKTKIDIILNISTYIDTREFPTSNVEASCAFLLKLREKCLQEISVYMFNDYIIVEANKHLEEKINEILEGIDVFYKRTNNTKAIEVGDSSTNDSNNENNDSSDDFKDAGEVLFNKTIEDVNGVDNIENSVLKQAVVLTTENENKTSSIYYINQLNRLYSSGTITDDYYKQDINRTRRNYPSIFQDIKEHILLAS